MSGINAAVVGYGLAGKVFHIPFVLNTPGLNLYAIVQRSPTADDDAGKDHPGVKVYNSVDGLCTDPDVRLVILGTGNSTHYPLAKALLQAGKDVVIDKPFTVTSKEADELIAIAKEKGRLVTAYQNRRFDADFKTLHKLLSASPSPFGTLVSLETHFDRYKPITPPDETAPKKWKAEQIPGNGMIHDLGAHLLDQCLVLFGFPDRVFGYVRDERGQSNNPNAQWGEEGFMEDSFFATLFYDKARPADSSSQWSIPVSERGLVVRVESNTFSLREQQVRFIVRGTEGGYVKGGTDPQEPQIKAGIMPGHKDYGVETPDLHGTLTKKDGTSEKVVSENGDYGVFYKNVLEALQGKAELAVKPEQARDNIRLMELIGESHRTGATVKVNE